MKTLHLRLQGISGRLMAVATIVALFVSALPVQLFVANAAQSLPYTAAGPVTVGASAPYNSGDIDASGHTNLHLAFHYDAQSLDTGDSFTYGWKNGSAGTPHDIATINSINTASPSEIGDISVPLPANASSSQLQVYVTVDANSSLASDHVTLTNISVTGAVATPACTPDNSVAGPANIKDVTTGKYFTSVANALTDCATQPGDTLQLQNDLTIPSEIHLNKPVVLDGNGHTITATFTKNGNSDNAAIGIESPGGQVTVKNLTLDGTGSTDLHGINTYLASQVELDGLAVQNFGHDGIVVNGSDVTVRNLTTSDNGWGGIDVDQGSGVTQITTLNVYATSVQNESTNGKPDILIDDISKDVHVYDHDHQYTYQDYINNSVTSRVYTLRPTLTSNDHVNICHATESNSHEYSYIPPTVHGIIDGHAKGHDDIIPPFFYNLGSGRTFFPGQNWTTQNQQLWKNKCGSDDHHGGDDHHTPVATSTVTMCKTDSQHNPLAGWQLVLLGAHVATTTVNPDGNTYSVTDVPAGSYVIQASGTYIYRSGGYPADAAFSERATYDAGYGTWPYSPWRISDWSQGYLGLQVNGDSHIWGTVFASSTHTYYTPVTEGATSTINYAITDDHYGDNSGSLTASLYHGYTGTTTANGCITFSNVPYGSYQVKELLQPGWTNVSGLGSTTVDQPTETITVVNHNVNAPQPPATYQCTDDLLFLDNETGAPATSTLSTVNDTTGAATHFADYSLAAYGVLAINDAGKVFTIQKGNGDLVTLNDTAGSSTVIGPTGLATEQPVAMEFAPDGTLYALTQKNNALYTIDPTTGVASKVADLNLDVNGGDVVFSGYNTDPQIVYVAGTGKVYDIDPNNSYAVATLGQLPVNQVTGAAYYNGTYYAMTRDNKFAPFTLSPSFATSTVQTNTGPYAYGDASACPVPPVQPPKSAVNVVATKIVCPDESAMPKWGKTGAPTITAATAADWVKNHPSCHLEPGWSFQWGVNQSNPGDSLIGPANNWNTFGVTNGQGVASTSVLMSAIKNGTLWVREVLQKGYVPFSYTADHSNETYPTAELYCSTDGLNYDNYDRIDHPTAKNTYYCVAWNMPTTPPPPVAQCTPGVNLIQNPSFEQPTISKAWDLVDPVAWTVLDNSDNPAKMELQKSVNPLWNATDGAQYTELAADTQVHISQTIPTVPGDTYTLKWDFGPRPATVQADNQLSVLVNGTQVATNVGSGLASTSIVWQKDNTYQFTAGSGTSTKITFAGVGADPKLGTFLDNTSLTCNPAPGVATAYCGDGKVDQSWEQCDGQEGCTAYCTWATECPDVHLAKITLDNTQSATFNGHIYLGTTTSYLPNGTWFNLAQTDTAQPGTIANDTHGLAVVRAGGTLKLAVAGSGSQALNEESGTVSFLNAQALSTSSPSVVGWPLELTTGRPDDQFKITSTSTVDFHWYQNTSGDSGAITYASTTPACLSDGGGDLPPLYKIQGYVFDDSNDNGVWNESYDNPHMVPERALSGWVIKAQLGSTTYSTTTNSSGYYSFMVPAGTWTVTEILKNGWRQTTNPHHNVTVGPVALAPQKRGLLHSVMQYLIPTAYAQTEGTSAANYNFGNVQVTSSHTGGGGYIPNFNTGPTPQVLGASTTVPNAPQVGVIPVGAPNAGAGGMAPLGVWIMPVDRLTRRFATHA